MLEDFILLDNFEFTSLPTLQIVIMLDQFKHCSVAAFVRVVLHNKYNSLTIQQQAPVIEKCLLSDANIVFSVPQKYLTVEFVRLLPEMLIAEIVDDSRFYEFEANLKIVFFVILREKSDLRNEHIIEGLEHMVHGLRVQNRRL